MTRSPGFKFGIVTGLLVGPTAVAIACRAAWMLAPAEIRDTGLYRSLNGIGD